jgi:hypothetical protein
MYNTKGPSTCSRWFRVFGSVSSISVSSLPICWWWPDSDGGGDGRFVPLVLKTGLVHWGRSKKAANQDLRTKKEVIPWPVLCLSLHKLCKNKCFLSFSKLLVCRNLYLWLRLSPWPVITRREADSWVFRIKKGFMSLFSL